MASAPGGEASWSARVRMADVSEAQRRSQHYGLDPHRTEIPHVGEPDRAAADLIDLSAPVLDDLLAQLSDSSLAVVMADREGRLTRNDAPAATTRAAMQQRSLEVGFSLAEADVGTNGVGTSLQTKRPTVVVGDNHFLQRFHGFTCAHAPIINPVSDRVEGTVGIVCPADQTSPLLLPTAIGMAGAIGDLLVDAATPEERFLLEQFLQRRSGPRNAVATIGKGVLIASSAAQRLLTGVDTTELWPRIHAGLQPGGAFETRVDRPAGPSLHLRCQPLHRGGAVEGAVLEFVAPPRTKPPARRSRRPRQLGNLVGSSATWQTVVHDALSMVSLAEPVLIVGERGTGRLSIARAMAAARMTDTAVQIFDPSDPVVEGTREWLLRAQDTLRSDAIVVLRRADQFPDDVAAALATMLARPTGARVMATAEASRADQPGRAALLDQLRVFQIEVPPLRSRREDIGALVSHFSEQFGRRNIDPNITNLLYRQSWPGNVTELQQTLRAANATAKNAPLGVHHLPRHIRAAPSRKPLHGLRQQEADAIVAAIDATSTRAEAAAQLGISRATLFRRIKDYGLSPDIG